jgi:hypothetical protein
MTTNTPDRWARWPLALATFPVWPIFWLLLAATAARLKLGYWPSYDRPDPKTISPLILDVPVWPLLLAFSRGRRRVAVAHHAVVVRRPTRLEAEWPRRYCFDRNPDRVASDRSWRIVRVVDRLIRGVPPARSHDRWEWSCAHHVDDWSVDCRLGRNDDEGGSLSASVNYPHASRRNRMHARRIGAIPSAQVFSSDPRSLLPTT